MKDACETADGVLRLPAGYVPGEGEFSLRADIETVILPEGLERLDTEAFAGCAALKEAVLPSSLREIGVAAFSDCAALERAELPDGLRRIGDGAFVNCAALRAAVIPKSAEEIADMAFWGCGFESVAVPEGVRRVGDSAFWACESLERADILGKSTALGENALGSCYALKSGYIARGYPERGDAASELLYSLLWCSCPQRHGAETSARAERFIRSNGGLVMEHIFRLNNTAALTACIGRGLLDARSTAPYIRMAVSAGYTEFTALLIKAQGQTRPEEDFSL